MARTMNLAAAVLIVLASPMAAQVEPANEVREPLDYNGLGVGLAGGQLFTASYRFTRVGSSGFGSDGAVTIAPEALAHGFLALALQFGPAVSLQGGGSTLLVKAGAAPIILASQDVGGALSVYYGLGLIVGGQAGDGLRVDWTRHYMSGTEGEGFGLLEVGFAKSVG